VSKEIEQAITALALIVAALGIVAVATGNIHLGPAAAVTAAILAPYGAVHLMHRHVQARRHRDEQVQRGLGLIHGYGRKT
jgi:succinate dehydrogenase hydrophobic anchor subunit